MLILPIINVLLWNSTIAETINNKCPTPSLFNSNCTRFYIYAEVEEDQERQKCWFTPNKVALLYTTQIQNTEGNPTEKTSRNGLNGIGYVVA
jgi:hypothetical protein